MYTGVINSKEVIRNRMLKHALNYWNIKNTEDLDPMVKLILEALSTELFNLGNEIRDTEVRLLEKIANLLAPEFLTCPNMAHAILHAMPIEPVELLSDTTHFYTPKKVSSREDENLDSSIDIFFTPVNNTRLFNANVDCIVTGNNLFGFDESFNKQLLAQTIPGSYVERGVCWLGVSVDEKVKDINNLYFYFDWKNVTPKLSQVNYQLLPLAKWQVNGTDLSATIGMKYESGNKNNPEPSGNFIDNDLLFLMEKDIREFYHQKFVSITDKSLAGVKKIKEACPDALKNIFSEKDVQKFTGKKLWIRIAFPIAVSQESLDELHVHINAFPVMNRQLNDFKYRLKGGSNIVPLKTDGMDQFLSIRSFADDNSPYRSTPYRKMEEEATGTYTLRKGGVERFDERNAKELISYLLELLRSESAAFSAYGHDFIASTLHEINQRIALMEQKTKGLTAAANEIPHYIIVKPFEGEDLMHVEYWTTLAESANGLRSGTRMQQFQGSKVKGDSLVLMSTTTGGKNRLKPEERLNAFRYGLITRNRIITKEDIRNICHHELGDRISNISIQKGFELSPLPKESFRRTIDIVITPLPGDKLNKEGWQLLLDQLHSKLQSRSGMSSRYRVLLEKVN
ncbi:MAG: hypothetical protein ABJB11_23030 [Ferruginibacter sp.]